MNKSVFFGSAVLAILAAAPALANPLTINDTTLDVSYSGSNPVNYSDGGFAGPSTGDFLGANFDTQKLVANIGAKSLELTYYTKFVDGSTLGAHYADIFLTPAANGSTSPASWAYGLSIGFQNGKPVGIYSLTGPSSYLTSLDLWAPKGTNFVYGGKYVGPDNAQNLVPVDVTGGSLLAGWTVAVTTNTSGPANYPNVVDVVLTAPTTASFAALFGPALDVLWGTADCANDVLFATIARVPEPMSLSIFGTGLVGGLVAYRRRKKVKAQA